MINGRAAWFVLFLALAVGTSGCGGGGGISGTFAVTGMVADAEGQGVAGITLTAGSVTTTTGPDGRYTFSGLRGSAVIVPEPEEEALFYPQQQTASQGGGELENFVRVETQAVDEPQQVPEHGILAYPGMMLDAPDEAAATVTISAVDEPPHTSGMTTAGSVYAFVWAEPPTSSVQLRFPAPGDDQGNLGIFYLPQGAEEWVYVDSDVRDGYLHGWADAFSYYGVFEAPQAGAPEADPASGEVVIGSEIHLEAEDNAIIHFTTDGQKPTQDSPVYDPNTPLIMGEDDWTIKALAVLANHRSSPVSVFDYRAVPPESDDPEDVEHDPERSYAAGGYHFKLLYVPGGGVPDSSSMWTPHARHIYLAETLVTYELWDIVFRWAEDNGYTFVNSGRQGGAHTRDAWGNVVPEDPVGTAQHPVTTISWRDAIVWCNALSEMVGLPPVYHNKDDEILRSSDLTDEDLRDLRRHQTDGFQLPPSTAWESAARYRDEDDERADTIDFGERKWTPEDYASGAMASVDDEEASAEVAWFGTGFMDFDATTQPVAQLLPNELGLYDMSGLVWEWTSTFVQDSVWYGRRDYVARGGSWQFGVTSTQVGFRTYSLASTATLPDLGLRVSQAIH